MMKFQLGVVAPAASLCYRYFLAGVVVLIAAALVGKRIRLKPVHHVWCALQGALMPQRRLSLALHAVCLPLCTARRCAVPPSQPCMAWM